MQRQDFYPYALNTLQGKWALITGASAGIGHAAARALSLEGVNLILVARREPRLLELRTLIAEHCPDVQVKIISCDLRNAAAFSQLQQKQALDVDILINNAGLVRGLDPVASSDWQDWEEMLSVNITAAFRMIHAILPEMQQKGQGDIVSVASIAGHLAYEGGAVYCATKHALRAFCTSLRKELAGSNVRSMMVSPGLVETEFSVVRFKGDHAKAKNVYAGMRPLTPEDIAAQIVFALKQPRHVSLDEILVMAQDQAGIKKIETKS